MTRSVSQATFDNKEALRTAKLGHGKACDELENTPRHMLDEGNPNHPKYDQLFGYDREVFIAKQYK